LARLLDTMRHGVDSSHRACKFGLYLYQPIVKYERFGLPGGFLPGGGRPGLKYGISRKIREIWQPYSDVVPNVLLRPPWS